MTKREMIERGRRAVVAAYPEVIARLVHPDDWQAHMCDTIVDILHYAASEGFDPQQLVDSAFGTHYMAEEGCGLDEEPNA